MTTERERIKNLIALRFEGIGRAIKAAVDAKDAYRKAMANIEALSKDYTEEYRAAKMQEAAKEYAARKAASYDDVATRLDELATALEELHSHLDLENPAISNALKLIELGGGDLDGETLRKINSSFATDQSALRALQSIYKHAGLLYDGGIDKMIYSPEDAMKSLKQLSYMTFMQEGGSLNKLAGNIANFAKLEGLEFDALPDPIGVEEAIRSGAGLATPANS